MVSKKSAYIFFQYLILSILVFFAGFIIFYRLGKAPLDNWDEAWYGEIAKEMIITNDFIIPHWNHSIFIDKAPLNMWVTVFLSTIIGFSETAIRLPSAISGFIIILLVLYITYKKYGFIPSLVAYSSITLNNIFIFRARSGNLDSLTTLLIFISYFTILSKHKYRLPMLAFLFACIYLTRTSFVLLPFAIFIFHELLFRKNELLKNAKGYALFVSLFIFLTGWWLMLGYAKLGSQFINYYVFSSDQGTTHISLHLFNSSYLQYTYYSLQRRLLYLFILGILLLIPKLRKSEYFLQMLFGTLLIVFLSFSPRGYNWYLTPSMPFWALIIGYATYQINKVFTKIMGLHLLFLFVILFISYKTFVQNIFPIMYTSSTVGESMSGTYLAKYSDKNDVVVRLDSLYPSMIFYSDRKVLVSDPGTPTSGYFLSRNDFITFVKNGQIRWAAGQKDPVDKLLSENPDIKHTLIKINDNEFVIKFTGSNQKNDIPEAIRNNGAILQAH